MNIFLFRLRISQLLCHVWKVIAVVTLSMCCGFELGAVYSQNDKIHFRMRCEINCKVYDSIVFVKLPIVFEKMWLNIWES